MKISIRSVDVYPVELPMTAAFSISSGSVARPGEKAPHIFVRVTADDGKSGWGECRPVPFWSYETPQTVVTTLTKYLAPAVIGMDTANLRGIHQAMDRALARGTTTGQPIARSAIDHAIHDLLGQQTGLTLRQLLGGGGEPATATLSYTLTASDPKDVPAAVEAARKRGYHHFNFKVGVDPKKDVVMARAIREAIGPEAFCWADANQGYDVASAIRVCHELERIGVDVLEQPIRAGNLSGLQQICRSTDLPIAVDEGLVSPADLMQLIRMDAIDVVIGKITRSGGLLPSRQIFELAQAAGLSMLISGLTDGTCTLVCACQLAVAFNITRPCALNGPQFVDDWTVAGPSPVQGDQVTLGDRPGHGLSLKADEIIARSPDVLKRWLSL